MPLAFHLYKTQCINVHVANITFQRNTGNLKESQGNKYFKILLGNGAVYLVTYWYFLPLAPMVRAVFANNSLHQCTHNLISLQRRLVKLLSDNSFSNRGKNTSLASLVS